ncbi:hypothetical protein NC652_021879 [Populus alba x Populus x berolinensis]|nr:hypothetical protein NC652_021879 [Populus alba x Populus x berolinensis]
MKKLLYSVGGCWLVDLGHQQSFSFYDKSRRTGFKRRLFAAALKAVSSMARRVPSCDDNGGDCGRGGGEALIPCSNICLPSCSFVEQINSPSRIPRNHYYSKCDMVGDIFYGTDDYLDVRDSIHREDVLEHYRREIIMRSLHKRKLSRFSISRRWQESGLSEHYCCDYLDNWRCSNKNEAYHPICFSRLNSTDRAQPWACSWTVDT